MTGSSRRSGHICCSLNGRTSGKERRSDSVIYEFQRFDEVRSVNANRNEDAFWRLKIAAFLHDPPHKALLLGRKIAHEPIARELIRIATGETPGNDSWELSKDADRIAAASDRKGVELDMQTFWSAKPKLIHPLSARHFDLVGLHSVDVNALTKRVCQVVEAARLAYSNPRSMFLWLWRCLADALMDAETNDPPEQRLGALWDLLPADTRIPEHTIWHHNRIVSAFAGSLPRPAMLSMSLGPVQSFISCARKTSDLWAGSYILAYLAWAGMKAVADRFGPDAVLFPDLRLQPLVDRWLTKEQQIIGLHDPDRTALQIPSFANRWLAVLPCEDVDDAARKASDAMRAAWNGLVDNILQSFPDLGIESAQWKRQIDWIEIFWAAIECPDLTASDASAVRSRLEFICAHDADFERQIESLRNHGWRPNLGTYYGPIQTALADLQTSRKLLRGFTTIDEPGYKCTLCGVREPLHSGGCDSGDYRALTAWWSEAAWHFDSDAESGGRERLCVVCATKRLSRKIFRDSLGIMPRFPSTSEIAATTFKVSVLEAALSSGPDGVQAALRGFCEASQPLWETEADAYVVSATERQMRRLIELDSRAERYWRGFAPLDGEWLFPERYANEERAYRSRQFSRLGADESKTILDALQSLRGAAAKRSIAPPSPYYAVLRFDGDRMGEWVSGKHHSLPRIGELMHPDIAYKELGGSYDAVGSLRRPQSPALQGALSAALLGFAVDVSRFAIERAEGCRGVVVYSGGDDVLAFLPIAGVLQTAQLLRQLFSEPVLIDRDGKVYFGDDATRRWGRAGRIHLGMGERASASAGIAIAHHLQPLSQVLEQAAEAEHDAKEKLGRDAFSVRVLKRSGERMDAGAKWEYGPRVVEIIRAFSSDELSPRFVHHLEEEKPTLSKLGPEAIASEVGRLLKRHLRVKEKAAALTESLGKILSKDLAQTVKLLSLATFIARHSSAEPKP